MLRFAPSPTGFLHVGNLRVALLNYLFAKKNNIKFFLRIDDTDSERSSQKYTESIISDLEWLKIEYFDIFSLICDQDKEKCHSLTNYGEKVFFDNGHISVPGSIFFSYRISLNV